MGVEGDPGFWTPNGYKFVSLEAWGLRNEDVDSDVEAWRCWGEEPGKWETKEAQPVSLGTVWSREGEKMRLASKEMERLGREDLFVEAYSVLV